MDDSYDNKSEIKGFGIPSAFDHIIYENNEESTEIDELIQMIHENGSTHSMTEEPLADILAMPFVYPEGELPHLDAIEPQEESGYNPETYIPLQPVQEAQIKPRKLEKESGYFSPDREINEQDLEPEQLKGLTKLGRSVQRIVRALQIRGKLDIHEMMLYGKCDQKRVYDIANVFLAVGLVTRELSSRYYVLGPPMEKALDIANIETVYETLKERLSIAKMNFDRAKATQEQVRKCLNSYRLNL